jgi:hypothetical protein
MMFRSMLLTVMLIGLALAAGYALAYLPQLRPGPGTQTTTAGLVLEHMELLSELVTTRAKVSDVTETQVQGYLGGRRALVVVKGEVLIGVDLSRARFESVDERRQTATLILPHPRAVSARLDHQHTRIVQNAARGTWHIVPGDAGSTATANRALSDAEKIVTRAARDPPLLDHSRRHAERVLGEFFARKGWNVRVRWE